MNLQTIRLLIFFFIIVILFVIPLFFGKKYREFFEGEVFIPDNILVDIMNEVEKNTQSQNKKNRKNNNNKPI